MSYGSPPPPPPPPPSGGPGGPGAPPGYVSYETYRQGQVALGERAGFGVRLGGYLLDSLLYGLLAIPFLVVGVILIVSSAQDCVTIGNRTTCTSLDAGPFLGGLLVFFAAFVFIFVLYVRHLGRTGQTWGRRIVGIKVVLESTGQPIGIGKAVGRTLFAWFVSSQVFSLGYLWMLWDDKQQTWHDKIVGTTVVRV